jgi:hypothetical protein
MSGCYVRLNKIQAFMHLSKLSIMRLLGNLLKNLGEEFINNLDVDNVL